MGPTLARESRIIEQHFEINDQMLRQLFPDAIKEAAKTFPADTGLGHDHVSPRALLRLSDLAIAALVKLFMAFEKRGSWTEVLDLVLIVLLPNTDGGGCANRSLLGGGNAIARRLRHLHNSAKR